LIFFCSEKIFFREKSIHSGPSAIHFVWETIHSGPEKMHSLADTMVREAVWIDSATKTIVGHTESILSAPK
jgi:hypothetical protein